MSFEKNLERIADSLEILAGKVASITNVTNATPDEKKKSTKKSAAKKKAAAKKTEEPEDKTTRADVQIALVKFCKEGPGKEVGKEVLEEFKAGSISTLDVGDYAAFVKRLEEVAAAVSA